MDLNERYEHLYEKVNSLRFGQNKVDLAKMLINIQYELANLDRESVECRQKKKVTSRYLTIEKSIVQMMDSVEEYLTMALLMSN
jgi:hypothetical protein